MSKKKRRNGITALYERLSRDDDNSGDSNSIIHQKQMLEDYAKQNGFSNIVHYTDDGWSGASFDRPAWNKLIDEVKNGKVTSVIVKDLSRVGRDHLQVGFFTDILFKEKEIHFIAIGNSIDSNNQESSEFAPFLNIMNEWYVRDTSKKIKAVIKSRGMSGKAHTSNNPCYGYVKDSENPEHWLVDNEAAAVIKDIYHMTIEGKGPYQIARILSDRKIERPSYYLAKKGLGNYKNSCDMEKPYAWNGNTVATIISRPEYIGKTVNFRTYKASYKSKKMCHADKDKWTIFDNTQEAIIDKETWELAQKLRKNMRRVNEFGESNPLTGKIICGECGGLMYNHREKHGRKKVYYTVSGERRIYETSPTDCYECSTFCLGKQKYMSKCTCHHINTSELKRLILDTIREVCAYATLNEKDFVEIINSETTKTSNTAIEVYQNRIERNRNRINELDVLIKKIYEDNISGRLSEKRFNTMLYDFETEQDKLDDMVAKDSEELNRIYSEIGDTEQFLKLVKRYTDFNELTPSMVNEFIDKVLVHEAVGTGANRKMDIEIYLNFIGEFNLPVDEPVLTEEEKKEEQRRKEKLERKRASNRRYMKKRRESEKAFAISQAVKAS